jgi:hypothetical protein
MKNETFISSVLHRAETGICWFVQGIFGYIEDPRPQTNEAGQVIPIAKAPYPYTKDESLILAIYLAFVSVLFCVSFWSVKDIVYFYINNPDQAVLPKQLIRRAEIWNLFSLALTLLFVTWPKYRFVGKLLLIAYCFVYMVAYCWIGTMASD